MVAVAPSALLFRTIETLGRTGASARVDVRARGGRAAVVTVLGGRVAAVDGDGFGDRILGDRIRTEKPDATGLELDERHAGERIGDYLVRVGRVPEGALVAAVRRQVRERLAKLLGWEIVRTQVHPEDACSVDVSLEPALDALVAALRRLGRELPKPPTVNALRLGAAGRRWLRDAPLTPHECALRAALERADDGAMARLLEQDADLAGFVAALCQVGALRTYVPEAGYATLAQAVHRLRHGRSAAALAGLPPAASAPDVRRALRRTAAALHPDHFARDPVAIRAASEDALRHVLAMADRGAPPRGRR